MSNYGFGCAYAPEEEAVGSFGCGSAGVQEPGGRAGGVGRKGEAEAAL